MESFVKLRFIIAIGISLLIAGCANTGRYSTQKGAAVGAGIGALAGQAIGRNTGSTLIGTGVGALMGAFVGNGIDQRDREVRDNQVEHTRRIYDDSEASLTESPPGRWVNVPGKWQGNYWIPSHRQWIPITPR